MAEKSKIKKKSNLEQEANLVVAGMMAASLAVSGIAGAAYHQRETKRRDYERTHPNLLRDKPATVDGHEFRAAHKDAYLPNPGKPRILGVKKIGPKYYFKLSQPREVFYDGEEHKVVAHAKEEVPKEIYDDYEDGEKIVLDEALSQTREK